MRITELPLPSNLQTHKMWFGFSSSSIFGGRPLEDQSTRFVDAPVPMEKKTKLPSCDIGLWPLLFSFYSQFHV